jgi:NhaP-type Na+/H+ or K+/H+ antiporter
MIPLALACLWLIAANVVAMLPSRDRHWTAAFILIAIGIPIVGWVTWKNGPWWGLLVLACGASVLRWPVIYLWRWVRGKVMGSAE